MGSLTLKQIIRQILQGIGAQTISTSEGNVIEQRKIREIKTTLLMFSTVFLFILCWVPWPIILNLIRRFRPDVNYTHSAMICYTFVSLNSMINPFLYVFHIEKWRESLKSMFRLRCFVADESWKISDITKQSDFWIYILISRLFE